MPFTLLHTADWHIAKPFGRFDPERAGILRRARLEAIDRLAAAARAGGARHVLVGGDVYDQPNVSDLVLREPMARLNACPDLEWHIIPGNHDPAMAGGTWERLSRAGLPPNVRLHLTAHPVELAGACWLLPAPLLAKATARDPTEWMDQAATPPGAVRIGLAHGSAHGFGSERAASVAISPKRARSAGLAYLALGDWHGTGQVGERMWYSGTPEPDGYLDNDPGNALLVRIAGPGAEPEIVKVATAAHRWLSRRIDLERPSDLPGLEQEVDRLGPAASRAVIEVVATGRVTIAQDNALAQRLDGLAPRVLHLSRRLDQVSLVPAEGDIGALGDGVLGDLATELAAVASDPAAPKAVASQRALRRLFAFADRAARADA